MSICLPLVTLLLGFPALQQSRPASRSSQAATKDALLPASPAEQALMKKTYPPYQGFCAGCHGPTGRGDGPMARFLEPKPMNFRKAMFKLVRTVNGVPSEKDLVATVQKGLPGSAMPAFGHMPPHMVRMAVRSVLNLARAGRAELLRSAASLPVEEAAKKAEAELVPGAPVRLPPLDRTDFDLEKGKVLFERNCALCHGADGKGKDGLPFRDAVGLPIRPRNFTKGVFKGGADFEDLGTRIRAGIPYAAMPAFDRKAVPDAELWDLVAYVRSFVPEGGGEVAAGPDGRRIPRFRSGFEATSVKVARVSVLPAGPDDRAWEKAEESPVTLTPLDAALGGRTPTPRLRAVHDGTRIAFRLRWKDERPDRGPGAFDRAGLQPGLSSKSVLFVEARFPRRRFSIFGPGWWWRADGKVLSARPRYDRDWEGVLDGRIDEGRSEVVGPKPEAEAEWKDGIWTLVFRRDLRSPRHPGRARDKRRLPDGSAPIELPLEAGGRAAIQCFLGDGSRGKGLRSWFVSHWIELALEP